MPLPADQPRRRPRLLANGDRPLAAGQVIIVGAIALVTGRAAQRGDRGVHLRSHAPGIDGPLRRPPPRQPAVRREPGAALRPAGGAGGCAAGERPGRGGLLRRLWPPRPSSVPAGPASGHDRGAAARRRCRARRRAPSLRSRRPPPTRAADGRQPGGALHRGRLRRRHHRPEPAAPGQQDRRRRLGARLQGVLRAHPPGLLRLAQAHPEEDGRGRAADRRDHVRRQRRPAHQGGRQGLRRRRRPSGRPSTAGGSGR